MMDQKQFDKIRAVFERSGVALTLVDMSLPEQPLVLANPAFLGLTGYTEGQVLGLNCRFLQRGDDNTATRAEIRAALAAGREAQVILRNHRADGSPFDNLLFLHPVGGRPGAPEYFLGSQFELGHCKAGVGAVIGHTDQLSRELSRIGAVSEHMEMGSRRQLAEMAAALVRAWESRR